MSRNKKLTEEEIFALLMESSDEEEFDESAASQGDKSKLEIQKTDTRTRIEREQEEEDIIELQNKASSTYNNIDVTDETQLDTPLPNLDDEQIIVVASATVDGDFQINKDVEIQIFDFMQADAHMALTDKKDIQWRKKTDCIQIPYEPEPQIEIGADISGERSPISYFSKYFTDDLYCTMVTNTNLYAMQNSNIFKPTDVDEMKRFMGIHLYMGATKMPQIRIYWERSMGVDLISSAMNRDRFFQLRTNLHYVNVLDIPTNNTDLYYKLRPLINSIRSRCNQLYLEENLCVDEQMIPFKGRLSAKQYVKNKPKPWGIKLFVLCGKSGQPYDFLLYQGSNTGLSDYNLKKFGFGPTVVLHLAARIKSKGHNLYFDNYFSSYHLFEILKEMGINACGTVRINRFFSPPFTEDKGFKKKQRILRRVMFQEPEGCNREVARQQTCTYCF